MQQAVIVCSGAGASALKNTSSGEEHSVETTKTAERATLNLQPHR